MDTVDDLEPHVVQGVKVKVRLRLRLSEIFAGLLARLVVIRGAALVTCSRSTGKDGGRLRFLLERFFTFIVFILLSYVLSLLHCFSNSIMSSAGHHPDS